MMVLVCGCASITAVQTADTVGRGNLQWAIESGIQGVSPRDAETGFAWPHIDIGARYGVTDRVDVSARMGQSVLELGGKVLLTPPERRIALSVGATAGGLVMFYSVTNLQFGALSAATPVLLGVKLGPNELVLGARAHYLAAMGVVLTHSLGAGGSLGFALRVSPNFIVMPEVGFTVPLLARLPPESPRFVRAYANGPLIQLTIGMLLGHTRTSHPEGNPHPTAP